MDGVIFDSERLYIECCEEAAEALGMERITEACYRCIGVTVDITVRILNEAYGDAELVREFRRRAGALFAEKYRAGLLQMKPGVTELLGCLKERGIRTAVASSTATEIVERELTDAGIRDGFAVVVGGDQAGRSKPNPDIFLKAAELLGVSPSNCVVIEDSFNGIRAAKAAGMTAVMVPDLLQPDEEIRALADTVAESLLQVAELVRGGMPDR